MHLSSLTEHQEHHIWQRTSYSTLKKRLVKFSRVIWFPCNIWSDYQECGDLAGKSWIVICFTQSSGKQTLVRCAMVRTHEALSNERCLNLPLYFLLGVGSSSTVCMHTASECIISHGNTYAYVCICIRIRYRPIKSYSSAIACTVL